MYQVCPHAVKELYYCQYFCAIEREIGIGTGIFQLREGKDFVLELVGFPLANCLIALRSYFKVIDLVGVFTGLSLREFANNGPSKSSAFLSF